MVTEGIINASSSLITEIGKIGLWLQALGIIIIFWIIFELIVIYYNYKRMKEIHIIKKDMKRIEDKINYLLNAKKK